MSPGLYYMNLVKPVFGKWVIVAVEKGLVWQPQYKINFQNYPRSLEAQLRILGHQKVKHEDLQRS